MPCVVSQEEFVKIQTNKLLEKMIKHWSQSASGIRQNKHVSLTRCRNYLRAIVVKFNE